MQQVEDVGGVVWVFGELRAGEVGGICEDVGEDGDLCGVA